MKRVACLYRVSTKKQVSDEDDIPMQKQACTEFALHNGWVIVKEYLEKGISGYKVSANDRDVLQDIKTAAEHKEFDVLLVFMFDRLGRREDETPFVVEWFCQQGIEVWSVKEGQQSCDDHTDKLLNYIRFWQANGESVKTSERVKTRMRQMVEEGKYTGGPVPYGYKLIDTGHISRKGRAIRKLVVDDEKSKIVKMVFDRTAYDGTGPYCMASLLNKRGLTTLSGTKFSSSYVTRMLKNKIYCGYFTSGDTISPKQDKLAIVDEETFDAVQKILTLRGTKQEHKENIARNNRSRSMISGNLFCGHCYSKMCATRSNYKVKMVNGCPVRENRRVYICYHRSRRLNDCDGQSVYQAERVEKIVVDILHRYFALFKKKARCEVLEEKYKQKLRLIRQEIKRLDTEKKTHEEEYQALNGEIAKVVMGKGSWDVNSLNAAIAMKVVALKQNEEQIQVLKRELESVDTIKKGVDYYYKQFEKYTNEFDNAPMEHKKMIICDIFNRIVINKGYKISYEMRDEYRQFFI